MLVAWVPAGGRSSGITHSDLKERWQRGDDDVTRAMRSIAAGVDRAIRALRAHDLVAFADVVDANFDLRCSVTDVTAEDREMVEIARVAGAAAKLCGSGGAVLVVPRPGASMEGVASALEDAGYATCRPELVG
jgi:glucuronokinase